MNRKPKIALVGSINYDLTTYVKKFPNPGETISAHSYKTVMGGKGLNQAVAAARCGGMVNMVGCIGADDFGKRALAHLKENGVGIDNIIACDRATGFASIMVEDSGENVIAVAGGANHVLSKDHVENARAIIEDADILIAQCEPGAKAIEKALNIARKAGVPSVLNPAPAKASIIPLLKLATYITPNQSETKTLTGIYPDCAENIIAALEKYKDLGADNVVITCGAKGSILSQNLAVENIPAFTVTPVDTTGAGDVFNGVFAYGIATGMKPKDAALRASAASALSVTKETADCAPSADEIDKFMRANYK